MGIKQCTTCPASIPEDAEVVRISYGTMRYRNEVEEMEVEDEDFYCCRCRDMAESVTPKREVLAVGLPPMLKVQAI